MNKFFGFTLIETLVAISTILVIVTIGINSYSEFNKRQLVDQTAKKIASDIKLAQSMALNQQKPTTEEGTCAQLNGYFFIRDSANSYLIDPDCTSSFVPSLDDWHTKSVDLSDSGIALTGLSRITFGRASNLVVTTGGNTLTVSKGTIQRAIEIGKGGDIVIQ